MLRRVSINVDNLLLVIRAALLANSVRLHKSSTLAALYESRSRHLPVSSSLISSSLGRFVLGAD
jgi:hypothetical protein